MSRKILWCFIALVTLAVAGCKPVRPTTALPAPPTASTPTSQAPPNAPTAVKTLEVVPSMKITQENSVSIQLPSVNPLVVQAIKDLANRLSVGIEEIQLVSAEAVTWPDGGLGCPRPGMVYLQVQQDGMRIVLTVAGKQYRYHSGERRPPFLCE